MSDRVYKCPLIGKEINEIYCLEYCDAVDGILKLNIIDNYNGTREEAQKICYNCPNRKKD